MKKYILILFSVLGIFFLNSCATDGDWENENGGQFGFKIERDDTFIEKGIGETNQIKFNIITNYDFSTIPTTFKFTTSLNGSLKLNGQTLVANQEYTFTSKNNIFEYVGNVSGTHNLKISVKNSKGANKDEEFSLPYSISEFTHTYTGGTAQIFQGDDTQYLMKITPGSGQPTSGYEIKFNSYTGTIKLNGVTATTGQYYTLPNIDNFNVTLNTNTAGQGALHYTIKNSTVNKDYSIQQEVIARQITVESMNISATTVAPNTAMSLIGVIKKTPITGNNNVQYKTWISSASNNNTSGIQNTNNAYVPYTLGANGSFNYTMNAVQSGTYTYNVQFKDEYGNESAIKTFNVTVENSLAITTPATASVTLQRTATSLNNQWFQFDIRHKYNGANLNVAAQASTGNGISKIVFELNFNYEGQVINKTYTYNYNNFPPTVDLGNTNTNDGYQLGSWIGQGNTHMISASNGTYTVYVYDKFNNVVSATGTTTVNVIQ
ncbi:malectin domain-containing carbohydrate-binding protein [Chryseobacterium fistulae]|uniref:Uncharacterized protein n=1 Tax=Chryseobacterium fistulae TaxID=2675058 RepID=A0A6N4XZB5_9FLAO|nr:malectin domain-containing carbohydrate-binding protein [Chryseobacterium fistulae]CAA7393300.1 hypothetical protein CHRY9393_03497 [Chryseobacterium fistulae]